MRKKSSGILLHISSLPSRFGIGDLGQEAYRFADFLASAKQSFWQVLPLNPTDPAEGNSPYSSVSAFAYNTLLISPEQLIRQGFISDKDCLPLPDFNRKAVDYLCVIDYKEKIFNKAFQRFKKNPHKDEYEKFCLENSHWLDDFALFLSFKQHFKGKIFCGWPKEVRNRQKGALSDARKKFQGRINRVKFLQFLFFKQWSALKRYCTDKNIKIIGDIPIYVRYDSADVWSTPKIFKLNAEKKPVFVAGVPPDYFSKNGQLWGNPVYKWDALSKSAYQWWIQRMEHVMRIYDVVRIDHFRGLVAYWQVPIKEKTAINGRWVKAPAEDFLNTLLRRFSHLPIIAEDLGIITNDVREVMRRFGLIGMKVLLFAFGEDNPKHPYLPHNYEEQCVVYTGTHDNNTARGWFENEAGPEEKRRLFDYIGKEIQAGEIHWELIKLAASSVADTVIFPLQDILGLGQEARMNKPATTSGNWQWRILPEQLTVSSAAEKLSKITEANSRA